MKFGQFARRLRLRTPSCIFSVEAQINGSPALFTLDSGAFWSMLTPASGVGP